MRTTFIVLLPREASGSREAQSGESKSLILRQVFIIQQIMADSPLRAKRCTGHQNYNSEELDKDLPSWRQTVNKPASDNSKSEDDR